MSTKRRLTKKAFLAWAARKKDAPLKAPNGCCPIDHYLGSKYATVGNDGYRWLKEGEPIKLPEWASSFVSWVDGVGWSNVTGYTAAKYLRNQNSSMRKKK